MKKLVLKVKGMQWAAKDSVFRFGNRRFPTLAPLAAFLHGKLPFPDPFPPRNVPFGIAKRFQAI